MNITGYVVYHLSVSMVGNPLRKDRKFTLCIIIKAFESHGYAFRNYSLNNWLILDAPPTHTATEL